MGVGLVAGAAQPASNAARTKTVPNVWRILSIAFLLVGTLFSSHATHLGRFGNCQLISCSPAARNAALAFENGRLPKNPLAAENGEG